MKKRTTMQPLTGSLQESFKVKQEIVLAPSNNTQIVSVEPHSKDFLTVKIPEQGTAIDSLTEQHLLELIEQEKKLELKEKTEDSTSLETHPALIESRNEGLLLIKSLTEKAQQLKENLKQELDNLPPASYRELIQRYLGKDFVPPTINQLAFPNYQTFKLKEVPKHLQKFNKVQNELQITKLKMLTAEAEDTSFDGLTSTALGHAFGMLSATKNGAEFVINHEQTREYLKLAETIRNIPINYILENPLVVAHKLIFEWTKFTGNLMETQIPSVPHLALLSGE